MWSPLVIKPDGSRSRQRCIFCGDPKTNERAVRVFVERQRARLAFDAGTDVIRSPISSKDSRCREWESGRCFHCGSTLKGAKTEAIGGSLDAVVRIESDSRRWIAIAGNPLFCHRR